MLISQGGKRRRHGGSGHTSQPAFFFHALDAEIEQQTCKPKRDGALAREKRVMRKFIVLSIYHEAKNTPSAACFFFFCLFVSLLLLGPCLPLANLHGTPPRGASTRGLHEGVGDQRKVASVRWQLGNKKSRSASASSSVGLSMWHGLVAE